MLLALASAASTGAGVAKGIEYLIIALILGYFLWLLRSIPPESKRRRWLRRRLSSSRVA